MLINQLEPATVILVDQAYGRFAPGISNQITIKPRADAPVLGEEVLSVKLEVAIVVAEGFQLAVRREFGQACCFFYCPFRGVADVACSIKSADFVLG